MTGIRADRSALAGQHFEETAGCHDRDVLKSLERQQISVAGDNDISTGTTGGGQYPIIVAVAADRLRQRRGMHRGGAFRKMPPEGFVTWVEVKLGREMLGVFVEDMLAGEQRFVNEAMAEDLPSKSVGDGGGQQYVRVEDDLHEGNCLKTSSSV
jgi:hypothetical protein